MTSEDKPTISVIKTRDTRDSAGKDSIIYKFWGNKVERKIIDSNLVFNYLLL